MSGVGMVIAGSAGPRVVQIFLVARDMVEIRRMRDGVGGLGADLAGQDFCCGLWTVFVVPNEHGEGARAQVLERVWQARCEFRRL